MRDGVIVTRPPPGLAPTMAAVAGAGWRPIAAPMLHVSQRALSIGTVRPDAIMMTSGQAIASLKVSRLHDVPCYVVGSATARRARAAGFINVFAASGTADDLTALVRAVLPPPARLLLAVGQGYGQEMAVALRGYGYRVWRRCVYGVRAAPVLPSDALAALLAGRVAAAMFYSTRTASAFMAAMPPAVVPLLAEVAAIAMSGGVADALGAGPCWRRIHIAARADQEAMLACLPAIMD
ncbi:uroporphyrinogen-III synthase [Komagataeibacter medellinensis NBRC 3288]|uniref:Uroporphyrinogen-III synthase n=1 Tax=Komagataeibacter medellinensis (strain NBRC 3288 / BCRC 11682 / LMG 1693 / Kondo 51) TaxID=634177 RepID=G2I2S0_KOMMN|nr:uroporphyrinogen-III synthase [Komagataeibacter medellinensis NBRC 3288]